jgi:hypothetical protein
VRIRDLACTYHGFGCANGHASPALLWACGAGIALAAAISALLSRRTGR